MADDPLMTGFFRLKSLLIEAQEEFGPDLGKKLLAAAMKFHDEHGGSTAEAYYGIRDEARRMNLVESTSIDVGEPTSHE